MYAVFEVREGPRGLERVRQIGPKCHEIGTAKRIKREEQGGTESHAPYSASDTWLEVFLQCGEAWYLCF